MSPILISGMAIFFFGFGGGVGSFVGGVGSFGGGVGSFGGWRTLSSRWVIRCSAGGRALTPARNMRLMA